MSLLTIIKQCCVETAIENVALSAHRSMSCVTIAFIIVLYMIYSAAKLLVCL